MYQNEGMQRVSEHIKGNILTSSNKFYQSKFQEDSLSQRQQKVQHKMEKKYLDIIYFI